MLQKAVVSVLALGIALPVAIAAPKVFALLKQEHVDYILPPDPKQRLRETLSKMKKKGLIVFEEKNGKRYPRLTQKGEQHAARITLGTFSIPKPRRWDRRWRMVMFDIKEARKGDRARIRAILHKLGFLRIQDSVWIHPYDCEEFVALVKTEMKLGRDVLYVIADAIEYDRPYREHFGLPLSD